MPHNIDLIITLTAGLTAAWLFGFASQKLRLSPIVGYLIAGVVVGPFTPGVVVHSGLADQLAEIGVILLMFGVGLHFDVKDLLAVRRIAIPGALVQIAVATALAAAVTRAFGWTPIAGVVFGLAISVASTVVLLRVLADHNALQTPAGHVAVGWLIVEDIFTVLVLVLLPTFARSGAEGTTFGAMATSLGVAVLKIGAMILFTMTVGQRVIPKVLGYVAKTRSRELFTLTVLVLALGIAVGSAHFFDTSMALGAFLAGMIVRQSEFSARAASEALPMRDAFAVLFFVSVGMLFDPAAFVSNLPLIGATLGIVLLGKPLAAYVVVRVLKRPIKMGLTVAVALAQIGEFSFILANLGRGLGILPENATQALVATSIVAITINAVLFRGVEPVARWLTTRKTTQEEHEKRKNGAGDGEKKVDPRHRVIVVGYGPVGRILVRLLRESGLSPMVIDLNHEAVNELTREGIDALYGDATQREILELAGIARARSLVFAGGGTAPGKVIAVAKELNPRLRTLARSTYLSDTTDATKAGADVVVTGETEVALAMTEHLLSLFGASAEQLDRARDRVRREFAPT